MKKIVILGLSIFSLSSFATGLKIDNIYDQNYKTDPSLGIIHDNLVILLNECNQKNIKEKDLFGSIITRIPKKEIKKEICDSLKTEKINFSCDKPYYLSSGESPESGYPINGFIYEKNKKVEKVESLSYCYLNKTSKKLNYKIPTFINYKISNDTKEEYQLINYDNKEIKAKKIYLISDSKYIPNIETFLIKI